jgi:hypothetical protein
MENLSFILALSLRGAVLIGIIYALKIIVLLVKKLPNSRIKSILLKKVD